MRSLPHPANRRPVIIIGINRHRLLLLSARASLEVKGEDDAMKKCDYCDGEGHVTALGEFGGKVEDDEMAMGDDLPDGE